MTEEDGEEDQDKRKRKKKVGDEDEERIPGLIRPKVWRGNVSLAPTDQTLKV